MQAPKSDLNQMADGTQVAKRDFGSFHSSNVQELIETPEEDYKPPHIPISLPTFDNYAAGEVIEFGKAVRAKHFLLEDFTYLNHGAFGGALREAIEAKHKWEYYIERQSVRYMDRENLPLLVHMTRRLSKFVGCDRTDLVLVQNVSSGMSTVAKTLKFKPGDIIYCLNITYGAVKKLLKFVAEETGAVIQEETITFPLAGKDDIINIVKETLKVGTKLAVFDHIPSNTPFVLPIKELIDICRDREVPILIDGAHGPGALTLNLHDLNPDFYIGNCHKWMCSPKGCGFMFVNKKFHSTVRPLVISHGFGSGFSAEYMWSGLQDYTSFLSLSTVLDFWDAIGQDSIRQYMHDMAKQAADLLVKNWNTDLLAPQEMFGSMVLIRLPAKLYSHHSDYNLAESIQNQLFSKFNIEVPIKVIQGALYVRISAHIYNEIEDYQQLSDAILKLIETQQ